MRTAGFIIILSLSLVAACGSKNRPPRHVLAQDEMESVLWDMMRADQFLFMYVLPKDSTKKKLEESQKYYAQIFQLHKITEEQFRESFAWYKLHPKFLVPVMDSIAARSNTVTTIAPAPASIPPVPADTGKQTVTPAIQPAPQDTIRQGRPKKIMEVN